MYLDYEEYSDMGGTLSELDFDFLAYEAGSFIDWYTFNRLKKYETIPQEVKDCEFHLIRLIQLRLGALGIGSLDTSSGSTNSALGQIASQSNDGVSVSYNSLPASEAIKSMRDEVGNIIQRYLQGVMNELGQKLLYRGLYPGE